MNHPLKIFGIAGSQGYAEEVAANYPYDHWRVGRSSHTEKRFGDGESYLKSCENVRDADVYVICSLHSDYVEKPGYELKVNEKLVDLLWFIGSLKDASAHSITAVMPILAYSRQDRKTESRAPITTKYMAQVLEAVGVNRILTMDVHSLAAFQNSFRIPVDNLDTTRLFVDYLTEDSKFFDLDLVVLTPDIGGIGRCGLIQRALSKRISDITKMPKDIPLAIFDKRRVDGKVEGSRIIGDVQGKQVLIFDDLIASGTTVLLAAAAVQNAGGEVHAVCATHGQFTNARIIWNLLGHQIDTSEWVDVNKKPLIKKLIVTDSIRPSAKANQYGGITVLSTAKLMSEAIRRTHSGGSISDLLTC